MKKNLTFNSLFSGLLLLMGGAVFTGCNDYDFGVDIAKLEHEKFQASGVFDFATTGAVTLSVDYDAPGANRPIQVYDEYPYTDDGKLKEGLEPVFAFFLNDGRFEGTMNLPKATTSVWLTSGGFGIPTIAKVNVIDGQANFFTSLTRAERNEYTIDYATSGSQTDNLAVFAEAAWQSQTLANNTNITVNDIKYYCSTNSGTGSSFADINATIGSMSYSKALRFGGSSTFESANNYSRVLEVPISKSGTLNVYCKGSGTSERFLKISTSPNTDVKTEQLADGSDKSNVAKMVSTIVSPGTYYIHATGDTFIFAITLTTETSGDAVYLTPSDYTYRKNEIGNPNPKIEFNSTCGYGDIAKIRQEQMNLVALYDWGVTGRPLATAAVQTGTDGPASASYKYEWYYNEDGTSAEHSNGITVTAHNMAASRDKLRDDPVTSPNPQFTVNGHELSYYLKYDYTKNSDGTLPEHQTLKVNSKKSGDLTLYVTRNNNKFEAFGERSVVVDGKKINANADLIWTVSELDEGLSHTIKQGTSNGFYLFGAAFTPTDESTTYYCYFDENGIADDSDDIFELELAAGQAVSDCVAQATQSSTVPVYYTFNYEDKSLSYGVKMAKAPYTDNVFTGWDGAQGFEVKVPAYSVAKVTAVFKEGQAAQIKINNGANIDGVDNVVTTTLNSNVNEDRTFYIYRGGKTGGNILYYFSVEFVEAVNITQYTEVVKKYQHEEVNQDVITRLKHKLWWGEDSKELAQKNHGGDNVNKEVAQSLGSAQDIKIVNPTGTKLYATFLMEHVMTSADVFGYYCYPTGQKPTIQALKKYIVFPNCTSSDYATSLTYKIDGLYQKTRATVFDNTNLIPLTMGDKVQLMYVADDGTVSETFPYGTTVGWFIIYNGFDAWDDINSQVGTGHIRVNEQNNNHYAGRVSPRSKFFYSDATFNDDDLVRCIAITDAVTKQVSLCFEDSYEAGAVTPGWTGKRDYTYDDLIFTITATNNADMQADGLDTEDPDNTTLTYKEKGTYLFEDIWEGDRTDFDMNDVAVEYNRTYTINTSNKIEQVKEVYTLINDGATYKDGFGVTLPYTAAMAKKIHCVKKSLANPSANQEADLVLTSSTLTPADNTNFARVEKDGDKLNLVLFDNINTFEDGDMRTLTYEVTITFNNGQEPSISSHGNAIAGEYPNVTYSYGRDAYNPFVIVDEYNARGLGDGKRCEIHLTGKNPSSFGVVPGADTNTRWFVARLNNSNYGTINMPFGLDIPIIGFKGCREGVLITTLYPEFGEWAKDGNSYKDWYLRPQSGMSTAWERVY